MNARGARFRTEIEAAAGAADALTRLARDAHARECRECRAELARSGALERLLERVPSPAAPPGLARRVLAGLAPARGLEPGRAAPLECELEELLEALPAPAVPDGLSERVLRGLEPERARRPLRRGSALAKPGRWAWLAAAGLLAALALWAWRERRKPERPTLVLEPVEELEADEELLAYAVERWELLHDEDLDVWLASLDPMLVEDELLTAVDGFTDGADWLPEGGDAPPSSDSSTARERRGD